MNTKPISPNQHAILDYIMVGSLLVLPQLLKFNKKAKNTYLIEALTLLPYIALTKQPAAIKGIIPIKAHQKIDPFNIAAFALQTFFRPFHKNKKELIFNIAFTSIAAASVILTDWNGKGNN